MQVVLNHAQKKRGGRRADSSDPDTHGGGTEAGLCGGLTGVGKPLGTLKRNPTADGILAGIQAANSRLFHIIDSKTARNPVFFA
jgi:hypothetical protein